jgi:hypothetical protein
MEVVGQSGIVLNGGDPNRGGACLLGGAPHGIGDGQYPWPICGGGLPEGWPGYSYGGGHQKPKPVGSQNPVGGGGGHMGGAPAAEDPPHGIEGV